MAASTPATESELATLRRGAHYGDARRAPTQRLGCTRRITERIGRVRASHRELCLRPEEENERDDESP